MLIGMQELDVEEWEANTVYRNYTRNSKQVQWFWLVRDLPAAGSCDLKLVLCFRLSENLTMKDDVVCYSLLLERVGYLWVDSES